ncbi:MAG: hypothetical protein OER88_12320, partial [Planctomycetota bacterium]|nr:hypothetical protein [Planctomycetota bacterium]
MIRAGIDWLGLFPIYDAGPGKRPLGALLVGLRKTSDRLFNRMQKESNVPQVQWKETTEAPPVDTWPESGPESAPGRFIALAIVLAVGVCGALYFAEASASAQAQSFARHEPGAPRVLRPEIVDAGGRIGFAWPRDLKGAT